MGDTAKSNHVLYWTVIVIEEQEQEKTFQAYWYCENEDELWREIRTFEQTNRVN
jgi:hypothetical protein